jgi:hypothetical protein
MGSINLVDPGYFPALRIPLLLGRLWSETENQNAAHVAVINQTLARSYFPNGDAVGHSVKLRDIESRPPEVLSAPGIADAWLMIVGVVADARNDGLRKPVKPAVFIPYTLSMSEATKMLLGLVPSLEQNTRRNRRLVNVDTATPLIEHFHPLPPSAVARKDAECESLPRVLLP